MHEDIYTDTQIEKVCLEHFARKLQIKKVIQRDFSTGQASKATIFAANDGCVYMLITALGNQTLGDVMSIVRRSGTKAHQIIQPHNDKDYFDRIARSKFTAVFPGKPIASSEDLRYYRSLAIYNPALICLSQINGEIKAFDRDAGAWRKIRDFAYTKVRLHEV